MKSKNIATGVFLLIVGAVFLFLAIRGSFSIALFVIGAFFVLAGIGTFLPDNNSKKKEAGLGPDDSIAYSFNVAGVSYRQKDIRDLCCEGDEWPMSKRDIIDCGMTDEPIYRYSSDFGRVSLVPDPGNEHDKNAIKVMRGDVLLGYVPKDETDAVRRFISSECEFFASAYGGPYKIVREEWDDDKMDNVYVVEKDNQNIGLNVTVRCKK